MPELEFTSKDIDRLASRLDEVAGNFDERDQAMMLAVFQLAADQLGTSTGELGGGRFKPSAQAFRVSTAEEFPSLAEGFRNSFQPEVVDLGASAAVEWDASVTVMGGW